MYCSLCACVCAMLLIALMEKRNLRNGNQLSSENKTNNITIVVAVSPRRLCAFSPAVCLF